MNKADLLIRGKYIFADLIDQNKLHQIFKDYSLITGCNTGLVDLYKEELIINVNWRRVCSDFHQQHRKTNYYCDIRNEILIKELETPFQISISECENGLVDGATPIIIDGKKVADIFTGQIFLKPPNLDFFRQQAKKYGFDEEKYIQAIQEVPIISLEKFKHIIRLLSRITYYIAEEGLNKFEILKKDAQIHTNEELQRIIAENSEEIIWVRNMQMELTYISPAIKDKLGYTAQEMIDFPIKHYTPRKSIKLFRQIFASALEEEKNGENPNRIKEIEFNQIHKNGTLFTFRARVTFLRNEQGKPISIVGVSRDITEEKRMEEIRSREERSKTLELFAGGLAHDYNNLLTSILGNIELLKLEDLNQEQLEIIEDLNVASNQARLLTKRLLSYSKPMISKSANNSITQLIKESQSLMFRGTNAKFILKSIDYLPSIDVDKGQINQVFNNLFINAIQSMPNGGTVQTTLSLIKNGQKIHDQLLKKPYIQVQIQDQGLGIPEEDQKNIFTPYYTTKPKGNGLGLATSYSIIKKHQGLITFHSEPKKGTSFYVYLPVQTIGKKKALEQNAINPVHF